MLVDGLAPKEFGVNSEEGPATALNSLAIRPAPVELNLKGVSCDLVLGMMNLHIRSCHPHNRIIGDVPTPESILSLHYLLLGSAQSADVCCTAKASRLCQLTSHFPVV